MSEIEDYLASVGPEEQATLAHVCTVARQVAPDAEDGRSYGMPALKVRGKPLLGFLVAKQHLSLFPFSPAVIEAVGSRLDGYELSKGTIRFTLDRPVPDDVLVEIVERRLAEIEGGDGA